MSTHPYYTKATLAIEIAGNPIGTNVGIETAYTRDLIWIPRDLHSGSTASTSDVRPYKTAYCYQNTDRFGGTQTLTAWTSSRILPFKDVLIIDDLLTEHFDVGKTYARSKYLFEDSTYEYYAGFLCGYSLSGFKWIQLAFALLQRNKSDGTVQNYRSGNLVYFSDSNFPSDVTDETSALAYLNSWLSSVDYFFITPLRNCSANSLTISSVSNQLVIGVKFDGVYDWVVPNAFSFNLFSFDSSDLIKDEGYEPEPVPEPSDDPYSPGGYSGGGGGPNPDGTGATGTGGLHDDSSDTIPTPSLPSSISTGSGLFTAYNPDASQLASFANSLWSTQYTTFDELFKILFGGDAFNAIIGIHLLPVQPSTGSSRSIKLGNWDSNVSAPVITNQYVKVQFGNLMLPEYWGNSIDYSPYTRIQLALPYIGIVDVDTDDVLGSNNKLDYNIDVLSGAICATLQCSKGNLNSVIYQWSGSCAVELPVTGANYNSMLSTSLGAALGSGAMASKVMSAVIASGGGSPITAGVVSAGAIAGAASTIYGSSKGKVQRSGAFGANSGALGIMTPYFIITRPVQSVPASWQADKGYPANISAQLSTLLGYTEVSEINLECSGTEAEKKEIIDLLKKGVLF